MAGPESMARVESKLHPLTRRVQRLTRTGRRWSGSPTPAQMPEHDGGD